MRSSRQRLQAEPNAHEQALLRSLTGKVAIANAKLTYQRYQELFSGPRWQALASRGAQTQRLLWASTGTKNPDYRDVVYVEELIGPDTVNTMPPATFDAFRDHGRPRASLVEDMESARDTMATLAEVGISMKEVTDKLLAEGVQLFSDAFEKLLRRGGEAEPARQARGKHQSPDVQLCPRRCRRGESDRWRNGGAGQGEKALGSAMPRSGAAGTKAQWLGWLGITNDQLAHIERLTQITEVGEERRLLARPVAGDGRIEPRSRK